MRYSCQQNVRSVSNENFNCSFIHFYVGVNRLRNANRRLLVNQPND